MLTWLRCRSARLAFSGSHGRPSSKPVIGVVDEHVDGGKGSGERVLRLARDVEPVESAAERIGGFPTFRFVDIGEHDRAPSARKASHTALPMPAHRGYDAEHVVGFAMAGG